MNRETNSGITAQSKSAGHRRTDAQVLFDAGRWRGAMYIGGYAVECSLKARLMRRFDCRDLADLDQELKRRGHLAIDDSIYTHRLGRLIKAAEGYERLRANARLWAQFNLVNQWLPAWRYDPDQSRLETAEDFLAAVDSVRRWIESNI